MAPDVGLLRDLVTAFGPSGFEQPAQEVLRRRVAPVAAPETYVLGNVDATLRAAPPRSWSPPMPTRSACR